VLAEVAEFSSASASSSSYLGSVAMGKGQSTYSLKDHLWPVFDPYYPRYNVITVRRSVTSILLAFRYTQKHLEQSVENYKVHLQKVKVIIFFPFFKG